MSMYDLYVSIDIHSVSTSQMIHLNLFGLYQAHDFDSMTVEGSTEGRRKGTKGTETSEKDDFDGEQGLVKMEVDRKYDLESMMRRNDKEENRMWEQAHRRNYVIVEE